MSTDYDGGVRNGETKATLDTIQINCTATTTRIEQGISKLVDEVNGVARAMSAMKASQLAQQETLVAMGSKVEALADETAETRGGRKALNKGQKAGIAGLGAGGAGLLLLVQVIVKWVQARLGN